MPLAQGQGSGDFRESSGRLHVLQLGIRNSWGTLSQDAFTQANPPVVTTSANLSSTLSGVSKRGILGSTVAFTRPDAGNGVHGGPKKVSGAYASGQRPLGLFICDALGNPYENEPGVASGRGPFVNGMSSVGVSLWETQQQIGGSAPLAYSVGDRLYASVNGLLTNLITDAYEYQVVADPDNVTLVGVLRVAPDAYNTLMVVDMRI